MGVFGALNAAVSGLTAQAFALENISGNIANSSTVGFKRVDTSFSDFVAGGGSADSQRSGTVTAHSRATNHIGGDPLQFADEDTFISIDGPGYFIVADKVGDRDGQPIFSSTNAYTRKGDFSFDKSGRLVNESGYYLLGRPIDPETGNISAGVPEIIQVDNALIPAVQTSRITLQGSLAADTPAANLTFTQPGPGAPGIPSINEVGVPTISADLKGAFFENSIPGDAVTGYNALGESVNVQLRWAKTQDAGYVKSLYGSGGANFTAATPPDLTGLSPATITITADNGDTVTYDIDGSDTNQNQEILDALNANGFTVTLKNGGLDVSREDGERFTVSADTAAAATAIGFPGSNVTAAATPTVPNDTWALYYNNDTQTQTGSSATWTKVGDFQFSGTDGKLLYPSSPILTIPNLSVDGRSLGDVTLDYSGGLSQSANTQALTYSQNGFPAGEVVRTSISDGGRLVATYSNGRQRDLYEITIATFQGQNELARADGGTFIETAESGGPRYGQGGSVQGQTLEGSNVEIADEFSKLIVTQQAYSANTRIITTADELLQETLNIVR